MLLWIPAPTPSVVVVVVFFYIYLFCQVLNAARGILSCSMLGLDPPPGIKSWLPALGVQSLSHWTTREGPTKKFFIVYNQSFFLVVSSKIFTHKKYPLGKARRTFTYVPF